MKININTGFISQVPWYQSAGCCRNAHVFNFGRGFPGQQTRQQAPTEPPSFPHQLLSILPILLMLAFTFFAMRPSEPVSIPTSPPYPYTPTCHLHARDTGWSKETALGVSFKCPQCSCSLLVVKLGVLSQFRRILSTSLGNVFR